VTPSGPPLQNATVTLCIFLVTNEVHEVLLSALKPPAPLPVLSSWESFFGYTPPKGPPSEEGVAYDDQVCNRIH
jgi:hypothetical protein